MKKWIPIGALLICMTTAATAQAQDKDETLGQEIKSDAKKAGHAIKKGAKKVGNETAEIASKGKARITDEVYKDGVGPNGETVYVDNHAKYYWVDEKGHRHYVSKGELKTKNG